MTQAKSGQKAQVHYTGTLSDGSVFDSSQGREPLSFVVGAGQVIAGFDQAVLGMEIGQSKTFTLTSDEAYGPHNAEAVQTVPLGDIPSDIQLFVGAMLQASTPDGQQVQLTVTELNDDDVTLDANHPLAGQDLTFEVELVSLAEG